MDPLLDGLEELLSLQKFFTSTPIERIILQIIRNSIDILRSEDEINKMDYFECYEEYRLYMNKGEVDGTTIEKFNAYIIFFLDDTFKKINKLMLS
jgi:hypothetical protein